MDLNTSQRIATEFISIIKPFTERIEVAGSVRRAAPSVNDIDIVLIPHPWKLEKYFLEAYRDQIETKRERPSLKWGQRHKQILFKSVKIELWLCSKWNWGLIYLIRTGSAEFSQKMLARWKQVSNGGYSENGYLHDLKGVKLNTPEEKDVFDLCNLHFTEPHNRN